jgi:hypothetical protein
MSDWAERMSAEPAPLNKRKEIDYAIGAAISRRFLADAEAAPARHVPVYPAGRNSDIRVAEAFAARPWQG